MSSAPKDSRVDYYLTRSQPLGEGSADRIRKVLDLATTISAASMLDIGCGDGLLSIMIKELVGATKVYGVELSPMAI